MTSTATTLDGNAWQHGHHERGRDDKSRSIEWHDLDKRKFYVIGPSVFMAVRLVLYPPVLVKTRLQVQHRKSRYNGTFDAFRQIVKYEGVRGLYKGFLMNSVGLLAGQCYVTTYEMSRHYAKTIPYLESSATGRNLVAGAMASTVAQSILVPVDVVSQLQMVQGQATAETVSTAGAAAGRSRIVSASAIARDLWRHHGVTGLYRGYGISLATFVPTSAIWWASYGQLTTAFLNRFPDTSLHLVQAVSGSCAGLISATLTNPVDVTRAVLQVEGHPSIGSALRALWKEDGLAFACKGLSARIMVSMSSSAIIICCYEMIKRRSLRADYVAWS